MTSHEPVSADSPRVWIKRTPIIQPVTVDENFCPWCGELLDVLDAANGTSRCRCGEWTYGNRTDWNSWFFRRDWNAAELEQHRQDRIKALEAELRMAKGG